MKKNFIGLVIVGLWVGLLQISGCGGDDPNPCLKKKLTKAGFTIGEIPEYAMDTVLISDTTLTGNMVSFKADSDYASYEWTIGDDPRVFTQKEVKLRFTYPESRVKIRLIAKWNADKLCFPEDDGIDTVHRYLTVIDYYDNPVLGVFTGSNKSNPTDSYNITVSMENVFEPNCICNNPKFCGCNYVIRNINKGCNSFLERISTLKIAAGYKQIGFTWPTGQCQIFGCTGPTGWLSIDKTGKKATINFSTLASTNSCNQVGDKRIKDVFNGVKKD